jgi:aspartate carbamoyltransferase regulatory subunit
VHTFGLGADHNPKVMKYIADETSGTYSFINQDISNLKYALMLFITGLTSIAVSSVQITVTAHSGVTISSIESGGYIHHVKSDKMSGIININHIYAGGHKNFIINLTVGNGRKDLLTIGGQYQSINGSTSLAQADLSVLWPWSTCSQEKLAIHHDVAAELVRTKLQKEVSAMLEKKHLTGQDLQKMWDMIKDSDNGHATPEKTLYSLSIDVDEMKRDVSGLAYMLSWLSCHKWQRATTKGTPNNSSAFQTIGQHTDEGCSMVSCFRKPFQSAEFLLGLICTITTNW